MFKLNLLIRTLFALLFVILPLSGMDRWFYDHFFQIRGQGDRPTPLTLIRVNDSKLHQAHGHLTVPQHLHHELHPPLIHSIWYHQFYDKLVRKIQEFQPRAIVFATFYESVDESIPSPPPYKDVIYSAILNEDNKILPPPDALTSKDNYGFANLFPEADNTVRWTHLVYSSGPALSLSLYNRLDYPPIERNLLEPLWIDFRGPANSYPNIDAWTILENQVERSYLEDRIVVIGREGSLTKDFETPFGKLSHLEIQANIIDTLIHGREIRKLPVWINYFICVLFIILTVVTLRIFPSNRSWLSLLSLLVLLFFASMIGFAQFKIWAGIANPFICILGTHLLTIGYRLSRQQEIQWKMEQEAYNLKEMDEFKNNFISLFSHDLKTPIAKIGAVIDRFRKEELGLTEKGKGALKTIEQSNQQLARYISDILKVTKMETMSLKPRKDVVDLNRLVETAAEQLKILVDEKKQTIQLDLEPLFSMEGDPQLLQEVITNLTENAVKYTPVGKKIIIRTEEKDDQVCLSVIDQGEGIPKEEIPKVTSKFYRGKQTAGSTKGSGLGLYLAKYFVELHRGTLQIDSEPGRGTSVSFQLPLPA